MCVIQHMHVVSKLSTFSDGDGGGGVGGGELQWYMYVCVIQYMHAVSKLSTVFDGDGGVGWELGSGSGICMCVTFITCMQ